ncbi:MAG: hypothetical protein ACI8RD_008747 [Bacillariaceae sp.]|jgi:hypothetical protein
MVSWIFVRVTVGLSISLMLLKINCSVTCEGDEIFFRKINLWRKILFFYQRRGIKNIQKP